MSLKLTGDTEMWSNVRRDDDQDRIYNYQHNQSRQLYTETQVAKPGSFQLKDYIVRPQIWTDRNYTNSHPGYSLADYNLILSDQLIFHISSTCWWLPVYYTQFETATVE